MNTDAWFSLKHLQWARLWLFMGGLLIAMILFLSLASIQLPVVDIDNVDKYYHFTAYVVLMGWFIQLFRNHAARLVIALAFISMGVGVEYLQSLSPIRHFDVMDMIANSAGVTLAWLTGFTGLDSILVAVERFCLRFFLRNN